MQIDETITAEGAAAFVRGDTRNPYSEVSERGAAWHRGWLEAAMIRTPLDLRKALLARYKARQYLARMKK